MILELLKENLSEELFTQVSESLKGKDLKAVPLTRFNEVNEAKKAAETKLETMADYEEIKTNNAKLKTKIESYTDYDDLKTKAEKLESYGDIEAKLKEQTELVAANKKLQLKTMGYDDTFIDYALTKIEGDDFVKSATEYLESNPKLKAENFQTINSQIPQGGAPKKIEDMTTEEYVAYREKHNVDGTEK